VRAVYPHNIGPLGYAVHRGCPRKFGETDSAVIYCSRYSDVSWLPADSGVDRAEINSIQSINGFLRQQSAERRRRWRGKVYVRSSDAWKEVFDIGIGVVNVVSADLRNVTVWVGGETAIFAPYIAHSTDKGATWTNTFPNLAGDNACNSISFDPTDTSVVYAGMEGSVIKSTDGGVTWFTTSLQGRHTIFMDWRMTASRVRYSQAAQRRRRPGAFRWAETMARPGIPFALPAECDGILCMTIIPTMDPEQKSC